MSSRLLTAFALAACLATSTAGAADQAAQEQKPSLVEGTVVTLDAAVTAVDQETRELTLQDAEGNSVTLTASEAVKNLPQVEVGDRVQVEYLEAVSVQVFGPDELEVGAAAVAGGGKAEAGEKPAGAAVSEVTVVAVIEGIDKESEQVTLKGPQGNTQTVKVRNPANLDKVAIGDKVMITYTEAMAVKVTEKPAAE